MKTEDEVIARQIREAGPGTYERWQMIDQAWFEIMGGLLKGLAEDKKVGWGKVNEVIGEYFSGTKPGDFLPRQWDFISQRLEIKERDCVALAKHWCYVVDCVGMDYTITECSSKRFHVIINNCCEAGWLKNMGILGKIDWVLECPKSYCPTLAKVINPKIKYIDKKAQCGGDAICDKIWEMRD